MTFARTDTSVLGRWWWTVDRWTLAALMALMALGAVLTLAASPSVANRIGASSFHFVQRQYLFLGPAFFTVIGVSLLSPRGVRRLAAIAFPVFFLLMAATLVLGSEIKGATRWLNLAGVSLQPSEFVKPTFAVVAAWMFASARQRPDFPGQRIALALYAAVAGVLLLQPDVGMTLVISAVFFTQFFLAGLPLFWVVLAVAAAPVAAVGAYFLFPHVASRVDRFLDPASGDSYQITTALNAFRNGGLWGRGPGEGRLKAVLPDAHTDFIFAVAGEEMGLIVCLIMVVLFGFIVLRGFARALQEDNLFALLAASGLLVQFGLQSLVNMASSLHMMPTKGMTLPFISYGGSSMVALALGMGMVLALTRKRVGQAGAS